MRNIQFTILLIAGLVSLFSCQKEEPARPRGADIAEEELTLDTSELNLIDFNALPLSLKVKNWARRLITGENVTREDLLQFESILTDNGIALPENNMTAFVAWLDGCEDCIISRGPYGNYIYTYMYSANYWISYYQFGFCVHVGGTTTCVPYGGY